MADSSSVSGTRIWALAVTIAIAASGTRAMAASPATHGEGTAATDASEPDAKASGAEPDGGDAADPGGTEVESLSPEELARRQAQVRIENAQRHYEEGTTLFDKGRYAEAAAAFERSYAAVPAAATLYRGVALSYERAGKAVEAVRTLRRYLALPECSELPPAERTIGCTTDRAEAEAELANQMRLVGELRLDIADGVTLREVRVAGQTIPLEDFPMLLMPGAVDVELFGTSPEQRRSRVAYITAGEAFPLYVAPFTSDVVAPPRLPPGGRDDDLLAEQQRQRQRALRATFWVGLGLTASAATAMGVVGGATLFHQRRHDAEKCEPECYETNPDGSPKLDPDTGEPIPKGLNGSIYPTNHLRKFERLMPITNAMIGVTVGLGVATALVGAFAFRKRDREQARVRLQGAGLAVRW